MDTYAKLEVLDNALRSVEAGLSRPFERAVLRGGVGAGKSGTASSIAFTPVQGLELVDPKVQAELKRKRDAENAGYFSSGTFTQVGGGTKDGFKVPGLPAKRVNSGMAPPPPPPRPKS